MTSPQWIRRAVLAALPALLAMPAQADAPALNRPWVPKRPYPYREIEASIDNPAAQGVRLAGTLTLPRGPGPFPAVVLICGSGPNSRDEVVAGHPIFLVLADHLTRAGIAVLRYDKRGIGGSTGDIRAATLSDFAADAEAAFAWLRARAEIAAARVGLLGHSEGGYVAPMVAGRIPAVAFVVLLAAPAVPGADLIELQAARIAQAAGVSDTQIDQLRKLEHQLLVAAAAAVSADDAVSKVHALLVAARPDAPPASFDAQSRTLAAPETRYMLSYDPAPALRALRCPVLALNGSKDLQVPADQNLPPMRAALATNRDATVRELAGLNHLFQTAQTGAPSEYGRIEETFAPAALVLVTDWIRARTGLPARTAQGLGALGEA